MILTRRGRERQQAAWRLQMALGYAARGLCFDQLVETFNGVSGDLDYLADTVAEVEPLFVGTRNLPCLESVREGLHHARTGAVETALTGLRQAEHDLAGITGQSLARRFPDSYELVFSD